MGGGVGIACPCRYRVATENTVLAMPETTIGIFPDVGGGRYLSRLRGRLAQFLALTGARLDGAECLKLRLATHYLPSARLAEAKERIVAQPFRVQAILDELREEDVPPSADRGQSRSGSTAISRPIGWRTSSTRSTPARPRATNGPRRKPPSIRKKSPTACKVSLRLLAGKPVPAPFRRRDADGIWHHGRG